MLGVHVCKIKNNTLTQSIIKVKEEFDINVAQIFTHGPTTYKRNNINIKDLKKLPIDLYIHTSYVSVGVWGGNYKSMNAIISQLQTARDIGAKGVVLHISKKPIEVITRVLKKLLVYAYKYKVKLILEQPAMKIDTNTYVEPTNFNKLTDAIIHLDDSAMYKKHLKYFGWCIDTAHLHGAGIKVSTYEDISRWLSKVDTKYITMIHLNGSSANLRSGKDKHEPIFSNTDKIWHNINVENSGVEAILTFAKKKKIPVIMEFNRGSKKTRLVSIEIAKDILST